jgi:16S rRNA (uracil1498-N3)-methyltransferase
MGDFDLSSEKIFSEDKELIHQLRSVLKIGKGEKMILCDGKGIEAVFVSVPEGKGMTFIREGSVRSAWTPRKHLTLCLSVPKKENLEIVVQKATELGVSKIIPMISARTVKTGVRNDRLIKIAKEASEQSGRGNVPEISDVMSFTECLSMDGRKIILHPDGEKSGEISEADMVFIGPEGGWTDEELNSAASAAAVKVCLGPMVMRAETAAIVASFLWSDIG